VPVDQRRPIPDLGAKPRLRADAIDLPLDEPMQFFARGDIKDLEFDAGGAGIDDQNRIHGRHAAGKVAARRRAAA
jgi:hypothetical protein